MNKKAKAEAEKIVEMFRLKVNLINIHLNAQQQIKHAKSFAIIHVKGIIEDLPLDPMIRTKEFYQSILTELENL